MITGSLSLTAFEILNGFLRVPTLILINKKQIF